MRSRTAILVLALSLAAADAWGISQYAVTDLGTFGGDYTYALPMAINNAGQVVGWCSKPGYVDEHAFLWNHGTMTDLGTFGGPYSGATGINSQGQVVGSAQPPSPQWYHSFFYDGKMHDLGTFGGPNSVGGGESDAEDINDHGVLTGQYLPNVPSAPWHAFTYDTNTGVFQDLGDLGAGDSRPHAINNSGQVVGYATPGTGDGYSHAFLYSNGTMQDLGVLPGMYRSQANDINDNGDVVGSSDPVSGQGNYHGFLYSNGTMHDLGTLPGFNGTQATGLNIHGQVVGAAGYSTDASQIHAFIYDGGTLADLNKQTLNLGGWTLNVAEKINDSGVIVGYGQLQGITNGSFGSVRAFLLTPTLPGDANLDGTVDLNDLTNVLINYSQTGVVNGWNLGDFNGDGRVDINDLTIVLTSYGQSLGSFPDVAAVAEPSAFVLLGIGAVGLFSFTFLRNSYRRCNHA
jgi:probable HAF family extracellular repeat protein